MRIRAMVLIAILLVLTCETSPAVAQLSAERGAQYLSEPQSTAADDLEQLIGPNETLGLSPAGTLDDLRGSSSAFVFVRRFDLRTVGSSGHVSVEPIRLSPMPAEHKQLVAALAARLPRLRVADHWNAADVVLTVCEFHKGADGSLEEVTTMCRIYRTTDNRTAPLRMVLKLGPYSGRLVDQSNVLAKEVAAAYEKANSVRARRSLPN